MSRHRNIRNLTSDDYYDGYDDDDYYDDDYYDEEENEAYYREQEKLRKEKEAAAAKKAAIAVASKSKPSSNNQTKAKPSKATSSKIGSSSGSGVKTTGGITQAPPGFSRPKSTLSAVPAPAAVASCVGGKNSVSGITSPPPGLTKPKPSYQNEATKAKAGNHSSFSGIAPVMGGGKNVMNDSTRTNSNTNINNKKSSSQSTKKALSPILMERLKSQKSRLSMVILGHVDAGKSTLMGQVLVQLGYVQQRVVTKYKKKAAEIGKASFALAWIMDEDDSERERGVTIDIATKYVSTQNHDLTILDAPGHADYVPAMITGAASADVGLLVIAGTPNEFESGFGAASGRDDGGGGGGVGQTREHIILARGLGVSQLIVAVNKLDAAEPPWSQERFIEIQSRLTSFLQANGFNMKRVRFIPISGLTGVNVKDAPSSSSMRGENDDSSVAASAAAGLSWYKGPTLLEGINTFEPAKRNIEKPLRVIISDVYVEGKGVTVKGRVVQGIVSAGDRVVVLPIGDEAVVNRVEHGIGLGATSPSSSPYSYAKTELSSKDNEVEMERMKVAVAGDSVDLSLLGIDVARMSPGNILSDAGSGERPPIRKKMYAKILLMEQLSVPIIRGAQVLLHMHSLDIPAVVSKLISATNRKDGSLIMRPRVLTGGANATVEIKFSDKICVEAFSQCRALGRIVLRRGGDTVAVGMVVENIET